MKNYLGQLRIYSLLDLIILSIAIGASRNEFIGIVLLHIGFLAFLESRHGHDYRKKLPKYLWLIITIFGLLFYWHIEGILFVLLSYVYTLKNRKYFATLSPVARGLQLFVIVAGVIGYTNKLSILAFILLFIRNFCGDLRDIEKDSKENMITLPVFFGMKHNIKHVHLVFTLLTTFVWFIFTDLNYLFLIPIFLIQIYTYNLTPR